MKKIIAIVLLCCTITSYSRHDKIHYPRKEFKQDNSFLKSDVVNDSILYLALKHYKIKYPKIVLAQAKLETGNYTSKNFKKKNNLFGLYNSRKKTYHSFTHWTKSIEAYKDMIEYRHKDGENYYSFLKRIKYASSPTYIKYVKQIEKDLQI